MSKQWRDATHVKSFPVGTWMAAGACLFGLFLTERYIVGPMRKKQEAEGVAPSVSVFGDISVVTGTRVHTASKELPDGSVLMDDGSIRKTKPSS